MHLEGIQPDDAVQFVGFSQGGLVATLLAADPSWNAVGLATYGAPAGGIALPDGISGIAVRNSDDFIPALAGPQLDHHLLQIERQAFAPGTDLPTGLAAPAHQRNAYVATATVIDQASSGAVRDELAVLDAFTGDYTSQPGATITATTFHAERDAAKVLSAASSGGSTR
jgi:pimeloyl-ACP methyl ester carboxylesterase